MRVLHVTESMGSGVEAAILDYVRSSPEIEHSLLFSSRGYHTGQLQSAGLDSVVNSGQGTWRLLRRLEPTIRRTNPDIVHFHSSWAGLVGRTTLRRRKQAVVYSPHSFFFDRTNLSRFVWLAARGVERLLANRTDVVAAVSPHEEKCARDLGAEAVYVPNIASIPPAHLLRTASSTLNAGIPRVVAVGRLSAQKDPDFFLSVKKIVDEAGSPADWLWIGGGEVDLEARLKAQGIEVTGWIDRSAALDLVAEAALYVHTAAWEGSPISLLEVEQLGVPAVVRSIPSVVSLGYPGHLTETAGVGAEVVWRLSGGQRPSPVGNHTLGQQTENQRAALLSAYDRALGKARDRNTPSTLFDGGAPSAARNDS